MANFNPQETNSLMALLSGLGSGLSGSQGYSLLQNILGQQQTRIANRQERMGSLIDMLTNTAAQGGSLEAAQALAGAYTHGSNMPPVLQDALQSLYPSSGAAPSSMTYGIPQGPGDPNTQFQMPTPPTPPAQQFSPVYQPPQPDAGAVATQQMAPMIADSMANVAKMRIGQPVDPANPEAGIMTPDMVMSELLSSQTFNSLDPQTQQMVLLAVKSVVDSSPVGLSGTAQVGVQGGGWLSPGFGSNPDIPGMIQNRSGMNG